MSVGGNSAAGERCAFVQQLKGKRSAVKGDSAGQGRAAAAFARGWWNTWQSQAQRQTHLEIVSNPADEASDPSKTLSATLANDAED